MRKKDQVAKFYDWFQYLEEENKKLLTENSTLKAEKKLLTDQVSYFQSLVKSLSTTNLRSQSHETTNSTISDNEKQSTFHFKFDHHEDEESNSHQDFET